MLQRYNGKQFQQKLIKLTIMGVSRGTVRIISRNVLPKDAA
jgi:hypothetical protein